MYQNGYLSTVNRPKPKLEVLFYKTDAGNEPVRKWLRGLPPEEKKAIGEDIKTVQWGWPLGMPLVEPFGKNLFEVRTDLENRIARVFFTLNSNQMILLHGIIKKDQKIPKGALRLARQRMKD